MSCCWNEFHNNTHIQNNSTLPCVISLKYKPKTYNCMFTLSVVMIVVEHIVSKYVWFSLFLCSNAKTTRNTSWPPLLFRVLQTSKTLESPKTRPHINCYSTSRVAFVSFEQRAKPAAPAQWSGTGIPQTWVGLIWTRYINQSQINNKVQNILVLFQ